jgi:predicted ATPase
LVFEHVGEPEELLKRVEEGERVARENSLPFVTEVLARWQFGVALIRKGELTAGVASLKAGLAIWENVGGRLGKHLKSALAEGMAQLGDLDGALDLIGEIIAQIERPGWEERHYYAETLRIKGWVLSLKGDLGGAERNYLASLDRARQQQAKSWELRTATNYARLICDQGRIREAYDLLEPIYGWFTEGFETRDLKEAKALLDELAS